MFALFGFRGAWLIWLLAAAAWLSYRACRQYRPQGASGPRRSKLHSARDLDV